MGQETKKKGIHTVVHGNFSESSGLEKVVSELKMQGFQTSDITIFSPKGQGVPLSVRTDDDESTEMAKNIFEDNGATQVEVLNEGNGDRDVNLSRGVGFGSDSDRVTSRDV